MDKTILAYIAGFIDGEGCIGLNKCNARKRFSYRLEVQVVQVDKRPLEFIQRHFGGSLSLTKRSEEEPKWHDVWHLVFADRSSERVLRAILPYLINKREKARMAIKYRELPHLNNIDNIKGMGEVSKARARVFNQSIIERRKGIYNEFKALVL